ncbi:transcription antitermination factor NusB [Spirulina subsalsa CS-330]|nr:transcription antitermination factor NusB [Spirulina subsalsa]MDB9495991.1 transcription antitermination factor NusB [Spirulina subsalsa CS-330]
MSARQQPRRTARELALLGLSQASGNDEKLAQQDLSNLMLAAVRTLVSDVRETLETAGMEVRRGSDRLNKSEVRAPDVHSARVMVREGLTLAEQAINRLGAALDLPEFINLANQQVVRDYAFALVGTIKRRRAEISAELERSLVDWSLSRLPQLDRQILMMAVAEMRYLDVPERVAINEAVELAKRYSDEEGARFINGVLRRVTSHKYPVAFNPAAIPPSEPQAADPAPLPAAIPPPAPEPDLPPAPEMTLDVEAPPEAIAPPTTFPSPEVKPIRTTPRAVPETPPEAIAPPTEAPSPSTKPSQEILRVDPRPPSTTKPTQKPILKAIPKPQPASIPNPGPVEPDIVPPTFRPESVPDRADALDLDELIVNEAIAPESDLDELDDREAIAPEPSGIDTLDDREAIAPESDVDELDDREAIAPESDVDELMVNEAIAEPELIAPAPDIESDTESEIESSLDAESLPDYLPPSF